MEEMEQLRQELIRYVMRKFASRPQISGVAEDIVHQAFANVSQEKLNFGYLSTACIHIAYRLFRQCDAEGEKSLEERESLLFLDSDSVAEEIAQAEDAKEILESLQTLKKMERIILMQRYYGDYSFAEIAQRNQMNLNTVLSHHRRALEKLRPKLAHFCEGRSKSQLPPKRKR